MGVGNEYGDSYFNATIAARYFDSLHVVSNLRTGEIEKAAAEERRTKDPKPVQMSTIELPVHLL